MHAHTCTHIHIHIHNIYIYIYIYTHIGKDSPDVVYKVEDALEKVKGRSSPSPSFKRTPARDAKTDTNVSVYLAYPK
jgi:hypothetical protein